MAFGFCCSLAGLLGVNDVLDSRNMEQVVKRQSEIEAGEGESGMLDGGDHQSIHPLGETQTTQVQHG
jgi:hypothetical protein